MSIIVAGAAAAATAGAAIVLKYSKQEYQNKITELEGYYAQLENHLARLEALKTQMFEFWDDEKARRAGIALQEIILKVRNQLNYTNMTLSTFNNCVGDMDQTMTLVGSDLEQAISAVTSLK